MILLATRGSEYLQEYIWECYTAIMERIIIVFIGQKLEKKCNDLILQFFIPHKQLWAMNKKQCRKCREILDTSKFYPDSLGKFWVGSTCRDCFMKKEKSKKQYVYRPKATGEGKIFDEIKVERCFLAEYKWRMESCVRARDYDLKTKKEIVKIIPIRLLTHWNFSHIIPKWRDESKRLDKSNIEIVSMRWHYREHNGWNLMTDYEN